MNITQTSWPRSGVSMRNKAVTRGCFRIWRTRINGNTNHRYKCQVSKIHSPNNHLLPVHVRTCAAVRFQVLTAGSMKFRILWDVLPCSQVDVDRRFRGAYCLHHQRDAARTSETSVYIYLTTWQYIPEDSKLQLHVQLFSKHTLYRWIRDACLLRQFLNGLSRALYYAIITVQYFCVLLAIALSDFSASATNPLPLNSSISCHTVLRCGAWD
jgi:hypothetical protein